MVYVVKICDFVLTLGNSGENKVN